MDLISSMNTEDARTENGALAHSTTSSKLVDLFFNINAMRACTDEQVLSKWNPAFSENALDAMRILFYSRDVRGGQGERRAFRVIIKELANSDPDIVRKNLNLIPVYGRWDDILSLFGTSVESDALAAIKEALTVGKNQLCAKWMPRERSANKIAASKIRKSLGLSPKKYRKLLSGLTNVVESKMCDKDWGEIEFSKVPSYAMKNYRNAFARNDPQRWAKYVENLTSGKEAVNASTLYPHDLVRQLLGGDCKQNKLLNAQWKALPNYLEGNKERVLPICDVSGSMSGTPMEVSIALGLYISERNDGIFKNAFITFSTDPKMQYILGNSLKNRVDQLSRADWSMTTDLKKTFEVILNKAKAYRLTKEQMPTMILILSDMQFDQACGRSGDDVTLMTGIRQQYFDAGYKIPKITFWNLRASTDNVPVKFDKAGTALVSGYSPSILKSLLSGNEMTPISMMNDVIGSERYRKVSV